MVNILVNEQTDNSSILESTKQLLGINKDHDYYDDQLIMHINSVFSTLRQIGIGPKDGFWITGKNDLWIDFSNKHKVISMVKIYAHIKVKLLFDPPQNSSVFSAMEKTASELEWRLLNDESI